MLIVADCLMSAGISACKESRGRLYCLFRKVEADAVLMIGVSQLPNSDHGS